MKIYFFIISLGLLALTPLVSAACSSNGNLTDPNYTICTEGWSPIDTSFNPSEQSPKEIVKWVLGFISKILLYLIPTIA